MSPGHQSCFLPPPLPCLFLIFSPHLLPFIVGANPFFTCQQYQYTAYQSTGHQRLLQSLCSACCLSLITAPQPSAKLQRKGERVLACSSHTAAALFVLDSRWSHRPTFCRGFCYRRLISTVRCEPSKPTSAQSEEQLKQQMICFFLGCSV